MSLSIVNLLQVYIFAVIHIPNGINKDNSAPGAAWISNALSNRAAGAPSVSAEGIGNSFPDFSSLYLNGGMDGAAVGFAVGLA